MPRFSQASLDRIATLDIDLQEILYEAIKIFDFTVVCGHRPDSVQAELYAQGRTKPGPIVTYKLPGKSIHNEMPSRAVDVAPYRGGRIQWEDEKAFYHLAGIILGLAHARGVNVKWGGHWKMRDYPHFEIST